MTAHATKEPPHKDPSKVGRIALIAGGGKVPLEAAHAARDAGSELLVIGIGGEANLDALAPEIERTQLGWGQVGAFFSTLETFGAERLVIVGSISKRPDFGSLKLDWGAVQMLPRLLTTVLGGDESVLNKVAALLAERGLTLAGVHEIAPSLVAGEGHLAGPKPSDDALADAALAAKSAWTGGHLDMGQGAVAVAGRIVALEGAEGTDGMLGRVGDLGKAKRFSKRAKTGCLAKAPRPQQDLRLDMPTIGPRTIDNAKAAGLSTILVEAGHVLVTQRSDVEARCKAQGVSLIGWPRSKFLPAGAKDERL
ncbi:MAG: LpxI family protein [Cohaesibacteraceae bacterium]